MTTHSPVDHIIDAVSSESADYSQADERRSSKRFDYPVLVGLLLLDRDGNRSDPMVLRAKDIAQGGLRLTCRFPLESDRRGVVQLVRSNGQLALAGVIVRHCQYLEDQQHDVGLEFAPMPESLRIEHFLDERGTMRLFDPILKENIHD